MFCILVLCINKKSVMKTNKIIALLIIIVLVTGACSLFERSDAKKNAFRYTELGRLTDPGENAEMLADLPDDVKKICDIANVQLVHYRMLSQWKIPRAERKSPYSTHHIKNMLDTLRVKAPGKLSTERNVHNRINGACTKESIFITALLRSKNIPARIRVGYLTNLYSGDKAIEFWQNVNQYERMTPLDPEIYDSLTGINTEVNRSIEHWLIEYWDKNNKQWTLLDMRPEFLQYHGYDEVDYFVKEKENFEYSWQVWQRRDNIDHIEEAYAERGWSARTHIRYQMLMDFYCMLNHEGASVFEDNGRQTPYDDKRRLFTEKNYDDLSQEELSELDALASLMRQNPTVKQLIDFYNNSNTLKIESMEKDKYSFIYKHQN